MERPDHVALVSGSRRVTYGELIGRAHGLAAHLSSALPDDGSPVAVVGHKEPEMVVGFLAGGSGRTPLRPHRQRHARGARLTILEVAGVSRTFTVPDIARLAAPSETATGGSDELDDHPYYVIFTSGSTGEPKGVVITLGCLESFVGWMLAEQSGLRGMFLNQAPFSFDLSVMDIYLSLATGGTLFSLTREHRRPQRLFAALRESITIWVSTPSFARLCLVERTFDRRMLPAVRRSFSPGRPSRRKSLGAARAVPARGGLEHVWSDGSDCRHHVGPGHGGLLARSRAAGRVSQAGNSGVRGAEPVSSRSPTASAER